MERRKGKERQIKIKKNETKKSKQNRGSIFIRRKVRTQFYLQKFEKNSKKLFGPKGRKK